MTTFHLIRHGEPDWNMTITRHLHPCRHDFVPLTRRGILEAEEVSRDSTIRNASLILSSPYTRALQTAAIISRNTDIPIIVEYDLHERLPDRGFTVDSAKELHRLCGDWETCKGDPAVSPDPLWEPVDSIRTRVLGVLSGYLAHREVIVVFHELAIRSVIGVEERVPHCGLRSITKDDLFPQVS